MIRGLQLSQEGAEDLRSQLHASLAEVTTLRHQVQLSKEGAERMNGEVTQLKSSLSSYRLRLEEANATIRKITDDTGKAAETQAKRISELTREVDAYKDECHRITTELAHERLGS